MNSASWENIRNEFKITGKLAYFQSAGMSPIPRLVYQAVCEAYARIYEVGDLDWPLDLEKAEALLKRLGVLLNTTSDNLAFLPNTSLAMSMVALSMQRKLEPSFNLISLDDEFPATHIPFEYQGIPVKYATADRGRYSVDSILDLVDASTRAVVCSYVQYNTGFRLDLNALGKAVKEKGLLFIVNATQALPFFPLDTQGMQIDVMTASMHKWGCAGHVGSLMYTSPSYRETFPAPLAGWLSVRPPANSHIITEKGRPLNIHDSAMQYQFGTSNLQSLLGLSKSLEYMEGIGLENIRKRILELATHTIATLSQIKGVEILSPHNHAGEQSGIISVNLKGRSNQECVAFLESRGVITTMRNNCIRISCNFFNNRNDIERLAEGIVSFTGG